MLKSFYLSQKGHNLLKSYMNTSEVDESILETHQVIEMLLTTLEA